MRAYKVMTTKYELEEKEIDNIQETIRICNEIVSNVCDVDNTEEEDEICTCAELAADYLERLLNLFD